MHDINSRYTFDTFVIGPSNRFAHAAALAVAETPSRKYNPLFVYGDAGLGKTHLLQAIAHYVRENYPTYRVRYVTSEAFLNEFIDAVRTHSNDAFKRRYRDIDVLLVDDIQFIEGKKETQEEFFHTFNHLHQANRQIVLSSDRPPDAIGTLEDRLRSRFKQGLITDIQPPDLETRLAILRNKAEREATWIPPEVLEFIATNITDNIRVLEGALIRVAAFASLTSEQLTVETAGAGARRPPHRPPAAPDHPAGDPRHHLQDVRHPRGGDHRQEAPAPARRRPPGGHVRDPRPHRPELPGHRPGVRRPRPHHRDPRRREDHQPDEAATGPPTTRSPSSARPSGPSMTARLWTGAGCPVDGAAPSAVHLWATSPRARRPRAPSHPCGILWIPVGQPHPSDQARSRVIPNPHPLPPPLRCEAQDDGRKRAPA